ncbi:NAD(P)/FAD-dependent oxidoreductase [Falsiroseomonas sp. CW058]|uniref:NAD(P)/FAD-dependent oxidoreductase n=1 Tax=Falsiroseomonas sp. CW058 TaxID=3388664 RepID=UPI003D31C82A
MSRPVILGAGPAGCAAAIALARAGRRPLLLEREARPAEKVCGEFLAADAAAAIAALGLDLPALGAVPIARGVMAAGHRRAAMDLPFAAWGLPRATLDATLLALARESGAEVRAGTAATGAGRLGDGWRLRLADGEVLDATQLVLATGKHELRGARRGARGGAIGVKLPLRGVGVDGTIVLLACAGGYAGLQPRPGGEANLCAALDPRAPGVAAAARDGRAFLAHVMAGSSLAECLLRDAVPLLPRPLTVAGVPYGFVARGGLPGMFRAGDQAAVIPSFCGDGVAMALGSGRRAAEAILAGRDAPAHHAAWAGRIGGAMRLAGLLGGLVTRAPGLLVAGAALSPGLAAWAARRTRSG